MKIIKAKPGDFIVAGQQGEELARRVEFDVAEWERLYGPGTVQLLVKRMTDETFYPVAIEQEQGVAIWVATVPETSVAGKYHTYELRYYAGETLAKAVGGRFSINEAFVGEEGEVPEVHQGWVDQIIATGAGSLAAQEAAEAARDEAVEAQLNANLANTEAQTAKQEVSSQAKRAETAANAAEESEKNAKSSEDAAVKAAEVAENSERNAIEAARQAELSKNGIVQAETNASQYAAAAAKSAADASTYQSNAQTFMRGAETARSQAQTSAQAASNFSVRAKESEEAAKQSEVSAAKSAQEAKEAAQNAGGGVSSWNDLTDKPFGETTEFVEIPVPGLYWDVDNPATETFKTGFFTAPIGLVVGKTYTVTWHGVEYEVTGLDVNAMTGGRTPGVGLGNPAALGGADNGIPFAIADFGVDVSGGKYDYFGLIKPVNSTEDEVTFSIRQEQTTITPLPAKYLPKGVPYVGEAEVPFDFTFDGDTTGKEVIEVYEGVGYVKVADIVLTRDDLTNAVMTTMSADEEIIYEFDLESIIDINGDGSIFGGGEYILAVQRDSEMSGLAFAPGLYFINYPGVYLVKSLIKEGATVTEEVINKLDSRCLPNGLPYIEEGMVELLAETAATERTDPTFGKCWAITQAPMLTVGETYTVIYNGVSYDCVCYSGEDTGLGVAKGAFAMGNFSVVGGANTGEPFAMLVYPDISIIALDLTGATSVRIGIMGEGEIVHKLDEKFLPCSIYTVVVDTDAATNTTVADKTYAEVAAKVKDPTVQVRAFVNATYEGMMVEYISLNFTEQIIANGEIVFTAPCNELCFWSMTMKSDGSIDFGTISYKVLDSGLPDNVATKADIFGAMEASY